jgi:hypothetical protein
VQVRKMEKECKSCRKRSCPEKKIIKLEKKLKCWFRAEKLSLPEGALLTEKCLDKFVEKILAERKKDRDAVLLLRLRREKQEVDREIDEDVDDEIWNEEHRKLKKNRKENKERLWYIG